MALFTVIVERGEAWDWARSMREQDGWTEHAAFMDALADDGFIAAGGPLGHEDRAPRILHVIDAAGEDAVRARLAEDPWHRDAHLRIASIEPWTVLLGSLDARPGETAGVIGFPPLIFGIPLIAGILIDRQLPRRTLPLAAIPVGLACLTAAGTLVARCFSAFKERETPVDPYEATTALVQDGPFARTRNPIYLGLATAYCGIALTARARTPLFFLPAVLWLMSKGVIEREEGYLERLFGDDYREYKRRVPRWL